MKRSKSKSWNLYSYLALASLLAACSQAPSPPPAATSAPAAPAATTAPAAAAPTAAPAAKPAAAPAAAQSPAPSTAAAPASAGPPKTPAEIYLYRGADRQQLLEEGAKKEGKITWYTSVIINDRARPLAEAFRKKYPFITVDATFMDSVQVVSRAAEEYNAKKYDVDFFEASFPAMTGLKSAKIISKFWSPSLDGIPSEVQDPDGFFVADRENPLGFVWNTDKVPEAQGPKTYDDLLDPKWKGKMTTNNTSQAVQFFGAMLQLKGDDYVRKLAQQDLQVQSLVANAVTQLVESGEVISTWPASVGRVALSRSKGAPVAWTDETTAQRPRGSSHQSARM